MEVGEFGGGKNPTSISREQPFPGTDSTVWRGVFRNNQWTQRVLRRGATAAGPPRHRCLRLTFTCSFSDGSASPCVQSSNAYGNLVNHEPTGAPRKDIEALSGRGADVNATAASWNGVSRCVTEHTLRPHCMCTRSHPPPHAHTMRFSMDFNICLCSSGRSRSSRRRRGPRTPWRSQKRWRSLTDLPCRRTSWTRRWMFSRLNSARPSASRRR